MHGPVNVKNEVNINLFIEGFSLFGFHYSNTGKFSPSIIFELQIRPWDYNF